MLICDSDAMLLSCHCLQLGPLIENAKFLLELRAEQKSSDAEKIIIVLIMLEVLLGLLKMMF